MKPADLVKYLPSEIIINILSRLPIRTIVRSKCVCKPWLHLLESTDFANSHLLKSVPSLAVQTTADLDNSSSCTIFEFEDGHDLESHELHYNQLTKFDFPHVVDISGSASGLLFLTSSQAHWVCNPITRDYIEIHLPRELIRRYPPPLCYPEVIEENVFSYPPSTTYGFGASRVTGEYKVVQIFHGCVIANGGGLPRRRVIPKSECHVYTLGTGSWRAVEAGASLEYSPLTSCVFLNGNLHWMVSDSDEKQWISCFDLETEVFTQFSIPPLIYENSTVTSGLSALGDFLCLCDHTVGETVIWLMKEYGVEESWTKVYVINVDPELDIEGWEIIHPIKEFKNGDVLMIREERHLFYYSCTTEITREVDVCSGEQFLNSILFTPSTLSLKNFRIENVTVTTKTKVVNDIREGGGSEDNEGAGQRIDGGGGDLGGEGEIGLTDGKGKELIDNSD